MKKIIISLFLSIFFISIANYAFAIEPDVFIQSTVNKASNILSNDEISKEEKIIGLKKMLKTRWILMVLDFIPWDHLEKT
jgi:phospholipid transport system substrate-binding protein